MSVKSIVTHVVETNDPVVDHDLGVDPVHAFVQEEHQAVFVLTVEVFLKRHFMAFRLGQGEQSDECHAEHFLACFTVGDTQARVLTGYQSAYGELRNGNADAVAFFHLDVITECGAAVSVVVRVVGQDFIVEQHVVVVHVAVVVGNGELEVLHVDVCTFHLLEDDADLVGVLHQ